MHYKLFRYKPSTRLMISHQPSITIYQEYVAININYSKRPKPHNCRQLKKIFMRTPADTQLYLTHLHPTGKKLMISHQPSITIYQEYVAININYSKRPKPHNCRQLKKIFMRTPADTQLYLTHLHQRNQSDNTVESDETDNENEKSMAES
ncbi:hypothetical protein Glove_86g222 [Diversispora epigaea]|uniref:Uncharacterized protein n=1 Tax=Diversispora epigaea TaxID=1348612 RepID=A0A397J6I6_9GLOM|nr:hypothetical protein Glove_86g222 [Diversispora epigaea]